MTRNTERESEAWRAMKEMSDLAALERAEQAVSDLCAGRLRWEMRVPADASHDPDLIIGEALDRLRALLGRPSIVVRARMGPATRTNAIAGPTTATPRGVR